jgi:hypothetical protein
MLQILLWSFYCMKICFIKAFVLSIILASEGKLIKENLHSKLIFIYFARRHFSDQIHLFKAYIDLKKKTFEL